MKLATLDEWFPFKFVEEFVGANIFLPEGLFVDNTCCPAINTFQSVDVFLVVRVPYTGAIFHLRAYKGFIG